MENKYIKFKNSEEMYQFLKGRDLYSKKLEMYVFLYNEDGAIAVYDDIDANEATELSKKAKEANEYWASFLGPGGYIMDDDTYDRERQHMKYLWPTFAFCEEYCANDDWMDTEDVTEESLK